jgi:hypothetical protein
MSTPFIVVATGLFFEARMARADTREFAAGAARIWPSRLPQPSGPTAAASSAWASHIAASVAVEHGLPFAVLRVVADPVDQRIPQSALAAMREDGTTDAGGVLRALKQTPGDLFDLPGVALNAYLAKAALTRACRDLGPGFGLADLG